MLSNRLAIAVLGVACVTAAAGGGYLATRHNVAGHQALVASSQAGVPAETASASVPKAVQETEGVVGETDRSAAQPPAAASAAPSKAQPQRPAPAPTSSRPVPAQKAPTTARAEHPAPPTAEHVPPAPPVPATATAVDPAPITTRDESATEAPAAPEPQKSTFDELTVAADSVIGLQTETTLSSERARIEDRVEARVVRDVRVNGRVAIPAGSRALGSVVLVERGGRARNRARLGIRFHTLALADGTRVPISTETIYRYGDDPTNNTAAKIGGGAVAGAILGAIIGGGKGAAIGATTGAAGGGAAVMASERSEAVFPSGAQITARIVSPVTLTVDRN